MHLSMQKSTRNAIDSRQAGIGRVHQDSRSLALLGCNVMSDAHTWLARSLVNPAADKKDLGGPNVGNDVLGRRNLVRQMLDLAPRAKNPDRCQKAVARNR
jgi:hypothetical protein